MYLQGNLQTIFDALYHLGVIDPVLEMDWSQALEQLPHHQEKVSQVVAVANSFQQDVQKLMGELEKFDPQSLGYLAMEVAREYADFHAREDLH